MVITLKGNDVTDKNKIVAHPKTNNQKFYMRALEDGTLPLVIAEGFAGTGKTYMATNWAAHALDKSKYDRIVIIRPPEPLAGRTVGFLKGSAQDKMAAWTSQLIHYVREAIGDKSFDQYIDEERIVVQLLETVRGMSFNNSIVIVDESQLLSAKEVQAITTRIGENTKLIFCGDTLQKEKAIDSLDGLSYLKYIIMTYDIHGEVVKFNVDDCMRSKLCKQFLEAYETDGWK